MSQLLKLFIPYIANLGRTQYEKFKLEVIVNRTKSIHNTIKNYSMPLFKSPGIKIKLI